MNNAISETSEDAIGRADCATSAGFIGGILSTLSISFLSLTCSDNLALTKISVCSH